MSVLIKGMEMPSCGLTVTIYPDGRVVQFLGYGKKKQLGTAIPVPPHGRLIDADALIEKVAKMVPWAISDPTANAFLEGLSAAYEAFRAAPTIIEAEEGET